MIIRNGFVRCLMGRWRNLDTIKYFDVRASSGCFSVIACLTEYDAEKDDDEDYVPEEDSEWTVGEYNDYDECKDALDMLFGYKEGCTSE